MRKWLCGIAISLTLVRLLLAAIAGLASSYSRSSTVLVGGTKPADVRLISAEPTADFIAYEAEGNRLRVPSTWRRLAGSPVPFPEGYKPTLLFLIENEGVAAIASSPIEPGQTLRKSLADAPRAVHQLVDNPTNAQADLIRFAGHDAMRVRVTGQAPKGSLMRCYGVMRIVGNTQHLIHFSARAERYTALEPVFEQVLASWRVPGDADDIVPPPLVATPVALVAKPAAKQPATKPTLVTTDLMPYLVGAAPQTDARVIKPYSRAITTVQFTPPVSFHAVIDTLDHETRLGFGTSNVIFNWPLEPTELRLDGGPARGQHHPSAGLLPSGFRDIELRVTNASLSIHIDGREIHRAKGDFADVTAPFSLRTQNGPVRIRSLTVTRPQSVASVGE